MSYVSFGDDPSVADLVQAGSSLLKPGGYPLPTPADTFNQILASSPVPAEVNAAWAPINDAVQNSPLAGLSFDDIQKDPSKAVTSLAGALPAVLGNLGIPSSDLGDQLVAVAAGNIGTLVNGQPGPLVHAAIATSASYACQAAGIPPELGTLAVDAVWKGEISQNTIEAVGAVTGAIAGAALGCYIGLPPMVGAFIGSFIGQNVGKFMSDALQLGGGQAAIEAAHREWAQVANSVEGKLIDVQDQFINLLRAHRGEYWANFDRIIDNISYQWQALECNFAFAQFPLLWSGNGSINPYFIYQYMQSTCTTPINQNLSRGTGCLNSYGTLPNILGGGCGAIYGCQYPTLPIFGSGDPYRDRVIQAFAAYDIWWVPQPQRAAIDDQWIRFFANPGDVPTDAAFNAHVMKTAIAQQDWASSSITSKGNEKFARVTSLLDMSRVMNQPYGPSYAAWLQQLKATNPDITKMPAGKLFDRSKLPADMPCPPYVYQGRLADSINNTLAYTAFDRGETTNKDYVAEARIGHVPCVGIPYDAWMTYWADYRLHCSDYALRNPNDCEIMCDREIKGTLNVYRDKLSTTMTTALDFRSIQAAAVRIAADLVSSAGVYAGAAKVNSNRTALIKGNLDRAIAHSASDQALIIKKNSDMAKAVRYGNRKNAAVNYAMLALGGGVLAASLMRRK